VSAKTSWLRRNVDDFHLLCPSPLERHVQTLTTKTSRTARLKMTHPTNVVTETPEPQLVGDARNGNRHATAELFRRHYSHSIAVARGILPAQEEFLDAVQSAYLSAFRNFQSFPRRRQFQNLDYATCPEPVPEASSRTSSASDYADFGSSRPRRRSAEHCRGFTHARESCAARGDCTRRGRGGLQTPKGAERRIHSLQSIWSCDSRYRRSARPNSAGNENAPVSGAVTSAGQRSQAVRRRYVKDWFPIVITNRNDEKSPEEGEWSHT